MFVSLTPDQISRNWPIIKECTEDSLPPIHGESPNLLNNILQALLDSRMICWISYQYKEDGSPLIDGLGITRLDKDPLTGINQCLIYTLYAFEWSNEESWSKAFITFLKYLKEKNVGRIIGYTKIPKLAEKWVQYGGNADTTLLTMNMLW